MATVLTDNRYYSEIAAAIREKNGGSDLYAPSQMAEAIKNIQTGEAMSIETIREICGWQANGLPVGYTLLEYIQSSGTQYINTGFTPDSNTRVVMEGVFLTHTGNASLFGARASSGTSMFTMTWVNGSSYFLTNYGSNGLTVPFTAETRFTLDKNKNVTTLNGEVYTATTVSFTCPVPLFVFATNSSGSVMHYGKFRLEKMQIYDNGTLARDYVPCINPSGAYGLYDKVNKQFYGNAGSGSFTGA